jgi:hypothetical protein
MDLKDRFFGRGVPQPGGPPVANTRITDPPGFALLFPEVPRIDADALALALRGFHPELAAATAELLELPAKPEVLPGAAAAVLGLVGWGRHVVKFVAFDAPMPAAVVEDCVDMSLDDPAVVAEAHRHKGYVLLFYAGYEADPLEQHVALTAVAAVLARFGAIVVINETARTSVPAAGLTGEAAGGDPLRTFREFPLPYLYAGFLRIELEGGSGVWMRTCGCHVFKLPDLAILAAGYHQSVAAFNLFANMLAYLRESGRSFGPGDTVNVGGDHYLRLRARTPDEGFLESPGEMLVAEPITSEETNT